MTSLQRLFDNSNRNKIVVGTLIVAMFSFAAWVLTSTGSEQPIGQKGNQPAAIVAVVQTVQSDVRQKPFEETSWYRAQAKTEVLQGDSIYSGAESSTSVRMVSGGYIELGQETLVIFDDYDGVTIPDLARGEIRLKITGNMKIAISGEITEFSGSQSELILNADGSGTRVRSVKGRTSMVRGTTVRDLATGDELNLAPGTRRPKIEIPKINDIAEAPIRNYRKSVNDEPPPSVVEAVPTPEPTPEPVAETAPDLIEPLAEATPEPTPEPVSETALTTPSKMKRADVTIRAESLSIAHPTAGQRFKGGKPMLQVAWNKTPGAVSYKVDIMAASDPEGRALQTIRTTETNVEIPMNNRGRFKLRVVAKIETTKRKPASIPDSKALKEFSIAPLTVYPEATGLFPHNHQLLVGKAGEPLYFKWQRSKRFSTYVVQFSADENFKTVSREIVLPEYEFKSDPKLTAGQWYWRVKGLSNTGESPWGKTKEFKLVYD